VVLDTSFALAWALEEAGLEKRKAVLDRIITHGAIVPGIWFLEVANALLQLERRGVLSVKVEKVFASLWNFRLDVDKHTHDRAWSRILVLARRHGLSAYDATYLELATREGLVLATLDKALAKAAGGEGILVLPE